MTSELVDLLVFSTIFWANHFTTAIDKTFLLLFKQNARMCILLTLHFSEVLFIADGKNFHTLFNR